MGEPNPGETSLSKLLSSKTTRRPVVKAIAAAVVGGVAVGAAGALVGVAKVIEPLTRQPTVPPQALPPQVASSKEPQKLDPYISADIQVVPEAERQQFIDKLIAQEEEAASPDNTRIFGVNARGAKGQSKVDFALITKPDSLPTMYVNDHGRVAPLISETVGSRERVEVQWFMQNREARSSSRPIDPVIPGITMILQTETWFDTNDQPTLFSVDFQPPAAVQDEIIGTERIKESVAIVNPNKIPEDIKKLWFALASQTRPPRHYPLGTDPNKPG